MKKVMGLLLLLIVTLPAFGDGEEEKNTKTAKITETVFTKYGPVTGEIKDSIRSFKGIPYAAPPIGNLRWKPPQKPESWEIPKAANKFGPSCPQYQDELTKDKIGEMDEDCLYLNLWTPAKTEEDKLPVMVWIHGGGFLIGSGSLPHYDGQELAKAEVIVVTINYRLGKFGFFAHPELSKESEHKVSGNYGILDQVFALKWVKDNIKKFGGNPDNVTIFGESAGGVSVCALIATPLAKGLFHRGICQSAGAPKRQPHLKENIGNFENAQSQGVKFIDKFDIDKKKSAIEMMREVPWQKLLEADTTRIVLPGGQPQLNIDGYVFPEEILTLIEKGKGSKVPLIIGTNKDEGTMFGKRTGINTKLKLRFLLNLAFKDKCDEVMKLYDVKDDASAERAVNEILGDGFVVTARATARAHSGAGNKTYMYHFTRSLPWMERMGFGCFHGAEIPYVFGILPLRTGYRRIDREISDNIINYWTRFAKKGDPNSEGKFKWPAYDKEKDQYIEIDINLKTGQNLRKKYCDFMESIQDQDNSDQEKNKDVEKESEEK